MTLRILVSAPYIIPALPRFQSVFDEAGMEVVVADVRERLSEPELLRYMGTIDGVMSGDDEFNARVLEAAAPRLRVISKWGTGVDSIDREAAARLGVQVLNTPGAFTEPVADSVMGYVLAFARQIPWTDRRMKAGAWDKPTGRALHECCLGVIGVGNIGKAVLRRASVFGMHLLGNDIVKIDPNFVAEVGVRMVPRDELLAEADFVSLNCDLNPTSRGLIDARALERMKPSAVLINTSRGGVVVESALIRALEEKRIAGAALDVFEEEPLPADSPLRRMDHVLLAPHNANSSPSAWERVHLSTIANLFRGLGLEQPEGLAGGGEGS